MTNTVGLHLLSALFTCLVTSVLAEDAIVLPTGTYSLSLVSSGKNSGGGASPDDASNKGTICYTPIAPFKRQHLASAASSIRAVNKTAAEALQQALFSGQGALSSSLAPYISYGGGTLFTSPGSVNVYLIFYGRWTRRQRAIVGNLVRSFSISSGNVRQATVSGWWRILSKTYYGQGNAPITSSVILGGTFLDKGSMLPAGSSSSPLTQDHIISIVTRATSPRRRHGLPLDPKGAYVVITDENTHQVDFCFSLCAYHSSAVFHGVKLAYAFVGNPASQCPNYCSYKYFDPMYVSANRDVGIDSVCDKLSHELSEIVTDPFHNKGDKQGWTVAGSNTEIADMCEMEFGNVTFASNNVVYNMIGINNMKFLLQMQWNRLTKECTLQ